MSIEESRSNADHRSRPFVRRVFSAEEMLSMFAPGVLEDFERRSKTMGPFEPDPSNRTPEEEAWLDRWVEGYCASGHDPDYTGPDDE